MTTKNRSIIPIPLIGERPTEALGPPPVHHQPIIGIMNSINSSGKQEDDSEVDEDDTQKAVARACCCLSWLFG